MNGHSFTLCGVNLIAHPTGGLFLPAHSSLLVSDLHFGKSERIARLGGAMLPPYETHDTLSRLDALISALNPQTVVCLGDSFDDLAASAGLPATSFEWLMRLMAGRNWIWIEGNHDPGPIDLAGTHLAELAIGPLTLRHIADPNAVGEISGHYHPKASLRVMGRAFSRPCFLLDQKRVIMPAFGTYTGGLNSRSPALTQLMQNDALAVLTGNPTQVLPMPQGKP